MKLMQKKRSVCSLYCPWARPTVVGGLRGLFLAVLLLAMASSKAAFYPAVWLWGAWLVHGRFGAGDLP